MGKNLYIAEKPSVAREFANALNLTDNSGSHEGYIESGDSLVTWCVGHLVTMSYPEAYDGKMKHWSFDTLPFIPDEYKYEVIPSAAGQYRIVSSLMLRPDVTTIYVCTDSGREGEYIYRLVEQMVGVKGKERKRVWIDSQTKEEIIRGISEAKDLSEYDHLSDAAYLRAREDYLIGINFSRALTLKYGNDIRKFLKKDRTVISAGRVMTCVLGMVVEREREIRSFVKTPFYRVLGTFELSGHSFKGEWKATETSCFYAFPGLYKDNGFLKREDAERLTDVLKGRDDPSAESSDSCEHAKVESIGRRQEKKNPPLLYNLAELQNECSRLFRISPDETLKIVQELYEKKMVTYPRTDARVLSSAVAKEIDRNLTGLKNYGIAGKYADEILRQGSFRTLIKTRYVNDRQITDHYAIIPTGQGLNNLKNLQKLHARVYEVIVRRFLCIFYPPAVYEKVSLCIRVKGECFYSNFKALVKEGYLPVSELSFRKRQEEGGSDEIGCDDSMLSSLCALRKGRFIDVSGYEIKEGETTPPRRYTSGSMILAMENAGQLIEDEELRAQINGSGIGTSATRGDILKKLVNIDYLALNKKTQILTPTLLGEMIYDVVYVSIRPLLNPTLTASWEKGLTMVADGTITAEVYMDKLRDFITRRTNYVKGLDNKGVLHDRFVADRTHYK